VIFYNDLSLDQLHAIDCGKKIREVIEGEPLSPVSTNNPDTKIEGLVTQPRSGLGRLFQRPTVYWRRAVSRQEASTYDVINDLGDENDLGNNAYDHLVLYRSLTADEKIRFRQRAGILILSIRHNRDLVTYISKWWSGPT
jgi:hypothetical protein